MHLGSLSARPKQGCLELQSEEAVAGKQASCELRIDDVRKLEVHCKEAGNRFLPTSIREGARTTS